MEILTDLLENDAIFSFLVLLASLIAGLIIFQILLALSRSLKKIKFLNRTKISTSYVKAPLRSLTIAICVLAVTPALRVNDTFALFLSTFLTLWLIASIGWLLISIVNTAREGFLGLYDINASDNLKARRIYTQIKVLENIAVALIIFLTIAFMLMSFDKVRQIGTSLLASAGILGVVLGFAAQKTLGNFIAGIQIALAQPIRLDDVVIVEGEWGWIEEISLTYVVVRIWDLRRLVVPISYFVENPFQNWTRKSADILGSVFIYADYTVPIEKIREELTRILQESPHWDKKVDVLQVTDTNKTTVEIRALMSAVNSPSAWNLRCEVREKLLTYLQKNFPESLPKTRIEFNKKID